MLASLAVLIMGGPWPTVCFDCCRRHAETDSRPCVFSSALLAAESLSLACARESNQREHTLTAAVAGEAGDCASPFRRFADSASMHCSKRAGFLPAPLRAFSSTGLPRPRGTRKSKAKEAKPKACHSGAGRNPALAL